MIENKALDFPISLLLYLTLVPSGVKQPSQNVFLYGIMVLTKMTLRLEEDKISCAEEVSATAGGRSRGVDS
jgi:hypothetical protein